MKATYRALFMIVTISLSLVNAQTHGAEWINPAGGNFDTPTNWLGGVPIEGVDAIFAIPANYTVNFTREEQTSNLLVFAGDIHFDLNDHAYNLFGNIEISQSTLALDGGTFNVLQPTSTLTISNGGKLTGSFSTVNLLGPGTPLIVGLGGTLGGNLVVNGGVSSHGSIAPGITGAGTLFINSGQPIAAILNTTSTLEIEVGGTIPNTQHDVLQLGGGIQLGGRLAVPFINGYTPSTGNNITFLQAGSVNGQFQSLSFPGLTGSIAAQINYTSSNVGISYVNAMARIFNSNALTPLPPNNWGTPAFWDIVPDSTSVVNVFNSQPTSRVIELSTTANDSTNVAVHQMTIGGSTASMTLQVPQDTNFTAVKSMTVGNRGIVELGGGAVHSNLVTISPGGLLRGNGLVDGSLVVGNNVGPTQAKVSPGFSPGELQVNGDLTIQNNGLLEIEIDSASSFDKVTVSQTADLGGMLEIDIAGVSIASIENTSFAVLTAGDVDDRFETVETVGNPDYFFAPDYSELAVVMSLYEVGDMNRNGILEPIADPEAFAKAVRFPSVYYTDYGVRNYVSGNIDGVNGFDFDDFDDFAAIPDFNITLSALMDTVESYSLPIPEPQAGLLVLLGCAPLGLSRRFVSFRRQARFD